MKIINGANHYGNFTYILEIDNKTVIIDPGYNYDEIVKCLDGSKPDLILLTHYHFDHVASVEKLFNKYSVISYIHNDDLDLLLNETGERYNCPAFSVKKEMVKTFTRKIDELPSLLVNHLPGHSPGSTTYKYKNYLFTGDILFSFGIGMVHLEKSNKKDMVHTINKLKTFDKKLVVLSGHSEKIELGDTVIFKEEPNVLVENKFNEYNKTT